LCAAALFKRNIFVIRTGYDKQAGICTLFGIFYKKQRSFVKMHKRAAVSSKNVNYI